MVRSLVVAVLLSLPLVACASLDGASQTPATGGASGGSPLAGAPAAPREAPQTDRSSARDISLRQLTSHDRVSAREFRSPEIAVCRQCR